MTIVVFVDASLTLIEMKQRARQMNNLAVDFGRHDFAALARAFGGVGETVSDRSSLERACREALARGSVQYRMLYRSAFQALAS